MELQTIMMLICLTAELSNEESLALTNQCLKGFNEMETKKKLGLIEMIRACAIEAGDKILSALSGEQREDYLAYRAETFRGLRKAWTVIGEREGD
jgi:hypothetical protein